MLKAIIIAAALVALTDAYVAPDNIEALPRIALIVKKGE